MSFNQDLLQAAGLLSSTSMLQAPQKDRPNTSNCGSTTSHEIQLFQGFLTAIGHRDFFKHSSPYSLIRDFQQAILLDRTLCGFLNYLHLFPEITPARAGNMQLNQLIRV